MASWLLNFSIHNKKLLIKTQNVSRGGKKSPSCICMYPFSDILLCKRSGVFAQRIIPYVCLVLRQSSTRSSVIWLVAAVAKTCAGVWFQCVKLDFPHGLKRKLDRLPRPPRDTWRGLHNLKIINIIEYNYQKMLTDLCDAKLIASLSVFVFWVQCQLFYQIIGDIWELGKDIMQPNAICIWSTPQSDSWPL